MNDDELDDETFQEIEFSVWGGEGELMGRGTIPASLWEAWGVHSGGQKEAFDFFSILCAFSIVDSNLIV